VFGGRQAHEEVIPQQVALGERHAFGVQTLEDAVGVVLGVQRDRDERQLGDHDVEEPLEVQPLVGLLLHGVAERAVRIANGRCGWRFGVLD
jgi:hypothetical protein